MTNRVGSSFDDISQYLERIREEKRSTDDVITSLEQDRQTLSRKIEDLIQKKQLVEQRLQKEVERRERQERGLRDAEETYAKLLESQQTLVDFVRKEYQDTKRRK